MKITIHHSMTRTFSWKPKLDAARTTDIGVDTTDMVKKMTKHEQSLKMTLKGNDG